MPELSIGSLMNANRRVGQVPTTDNSEGTGR